MGVTYETKDTVAYQEAKPHFVELSEPATNPQTKEWLEFANARESLIMILLITQFPTDDWAITEANHLEMFKRVYMVERVVGAMRFNINKADSQPVFFKLPEFKRFIGMTVNAGSQTNAKFNRDISRRLRLRAEDHIRATQ